MLLFAAASTTDAIEEIVAEFQREHGVTVRTNFAGSSTLARQMAASGGAHLFLSANAKWADYLSDEQLVARRRDLLSNRLVVVVPADSPLDIDAPAELLSDEVEHIALADPDAVPAGIYARQALEKLGLWQKLQHKVAAGDHVRRALMYVGSGETEAGIVYKTDAAATADVRVAFEIDPSLTEPIRYPLVLLNEGNKNPEAKALYEFFRSDRAAAIFEKHGFEVLANDETPQLAVPSD